MKSAREEAGTPLEVIADRTKIARSVLEALEAGEFAKLPNRVFVRLFLRQYLAIIGEDPAKWSAALEGAWDRFERATQPFPVIPVAPATSRRWLPWLVGLGVVIAALTTVLLIERKREPQEGGAAPPTPEVLLPHLSPTAPPATPPGQIEVSSAPSPTGLADPGPAVGATPSAEHQPVAGVTDGPRTAMPVATVGPGDDTILVVRATARSCWVEITVAGFAPVTRLLEAGAELRIPAAGRAVALTVGDAGAASVEYLGQSLNPTGEDGKVVHLRLGPSPTGQGF